MKGILLKDWYVIWKQGKFMFLLALLYLFMTAMGSNTFFGGFAVLFLSMLPITVMGLDERSKWDRFAVALPVSRKQLVVEKYLCSLIGLGTGAALYLIFAVAGAVFTHRAVNLAVLLVALSPMLSAGLLFSAVSFPVILKAGVEKGRLWFLLIIAFLAAMLGGLLALSSGEGEIPQFLSSGGLLWILPIAILLFVLSIPLSIRIYNKREL